MSYENDIEKLKSDLEDIIQLIEQTNLEESSYATNEYHSNETKMKLEDLTKTLNVKFRICLQNLNENVREYFLYLFQDYHYSFANGSFQETLKKYILKNLLNDLQAIKDSFQAFNSSFQGHFSFVKFYLLKYPKYKDQFSIYGTTFLYSSSRNNHFQLVQFLIETVHCNVNQQNKRILSNQTQSSPTSGSTPLHAACFYGHLDIVKYLIDHHADYFIENDAKETPIQNGLLHEHIQEYFSNYFIFSYKNQSKKNTWPSKRIADENQIENDSIWEYKSLFNNQWILFDQNNSNQLQSYLQNYQINSNVSNSLEINEQTFQINFLRFLATSNSNDDSFWIRCRGSSILNFNFYSKWQIYFEKPFSNHSTKKSSLLEFANCNSDSFEFNHWYHFHNQQLDYAMNMRQKILHLSLPFFPHTHLFTFNLYTFTFSNQQLNVQGQLRWIPLLISKQTQTNIDDYQSLNQNDIQIKSRHTSEIDENPLIDVRYGDLTQEKSDAIVVCWCSEYLLGLIYESGGEMIRKTIESWIEKKKKTRLISINADGKIQATKIYFVDFVIEKQIDLIEKSYENLLELVLKKGSEDKLKHISFPALAFGYFKTYEDQITKTLIEKLIDEQISYKISVSFLIESNQHEIYNCFHKYIQFYAKQYSNSMIISNSSIEIDKGDLTKQNVDVIVVSSSSSDLTQIVLIEAGEEIHQNYMRETQLNPHSLLIITSSGYLLCKRIFFVQLNLTETNLRQSIEDFISNIIQNVVLNQFQSIAFPLIGFNHENLSFKSIIQMILNELIYQIKLRNLSLQIKFIVLPDQQQIYDLFRRELFFCQQNNQVQEDETIPSTWTQSCSNNNNHRSIVSNKSNEYKQIEDEFRRLMKEKLKKIIQIERIENERWFHQYLAHKKDFFKRLKKDTERRLYHGCPQHCVDSIVQDCFNRSFAGVNGTSYGLGVYFSSDPIYSNQFAKANTHGEKCMFIARVLIGNATIGNSTMKTRPPGFDTTTDGNHIFVTYHDAQAYAEYLITYK